jgi:hypothetical protein
MVAELASLHLHTLGVHAMPVPRRNFFYHAITMISL